jgi:hypothetical protein
MRMTSARWKTAVAGADGVVNAVSQYVERGSATFRPVHVEAAAQVASAARRAGVKRLAHLTGCLCARARQRGNKFCRRYLSAKNLGLPTEVANAGFSGNHGHLRDYADGYALVKSFQTSEFIYTRSGSVRILLSPYRAGITGR